MTDNKLTNAQIAATAGRLGGFSETRSLGQQWDNVYELVRKVIAERAALAQQDALAVPQGWQPTETAPKDGTVVDLWICAEGCEFRAPDFKFCNGRWQGKTSDEPLEWHYMNAKMQPTHWMPLPAPPDTAPTPPAQQDVQTGSPDHGELYAQGWLNGTQVQSLIDWCNEADRKPPNIAYTSGPVRQLAYAISAAVWRSYRAGMETSARLCDDRVDESANQQRNAAFRNDPYGQKLAMLDGEVAKWLAIEIRARAKTTEAALPWDVAMPPDRCQGTNCGAADGQDHSPECIVETAEAQGWGDAPEVVAARQLLNAAPTPPAQQPDEIRQLQTMLHTSDTLRAKLVQERDDLLAALERERESRKTAQTQLYDEYERRSKTGLQHNTEKSRLIRRIEELTAAATAAEDALRYLGATVHADSLHAVIAKVRGAQ